jgi:hypothetical protein
MQLICCFVLLLIVCDLAISWRSSYIVAIHTARFRPLSFRLGVVPPLPSTQACPEGKVSTKETTKGRQKNTAPKTLSLFRGGHEGERGEDQPLFPTRSAQLLSLLPPLLFPFTPFPLRRLALCVFLNLTGDQPPHISGGEELQDCLATTLVGEEVTDLEAILTSLRLPPHLGPQDSLLPFSVRALEEVSRCAL